MIRSGQWGDLMGAGPRLRDDLEGMDTGRPARRRPALSGDAMDLRTASVLGHAAKIRERRGEEKPRWAGIEWFVRETLAESPLVQVVDVLLIPVGARAGTEETLGHLFGAPY